MHSRTEHVIRIIRTGAFLQREIDRLLRKRGLNTQQLIVLDEIKSEGVINQSRLVSNLGYEKSNISKIISKLKSLGFIKVRTDSLDGRVTNLKVTGRGSKTVKKCMKKLSAMSIGMKETQPEGDTEQISSDLSRLMNQF